jgi:hypothetical protein
MRSNTFRVGYQFSPCDHLASVQSQLPSFLWLWAQAQTRALHPSSASRTLHAPTVASRTLRRLDDGDRDTRRPRLDGRADGRLAGLHQRVGAPRASLRRREARRQAPLCALGPPPLCARGARAPPRGDGLGRGGRRRGARSGHRRAVRREGVCSVQRNASAGQREPTVVPGHRDCVTKQNSCRGYEHFRHASAQSYLMCSSLFLCLSGVLRDGGRGQAYRRYCGKWMDLNLPHTIIW